MTFEKLQDPELGDTFVQVTLRDEEIDTVSRALRIFGGRMCPYQESRAIGGALLELARPRAEDEEARVFYARKENGHLSAILKALPAMPVEEGPALCPISGQLCRRSQDSTEVRARIECFANEYFAGLAPFVMERIDIESGLDRLLRETTK